MCQVEPLGRLGWSLYDHAVKTETLALTRLGIIFWVPEVCVSNRLLQTVLFLTDSVFRVLFAYFDESMASKIVYKP